MMRVSVYTNNNGMWTKVEWNDADDLCEISGEQFGQFRVNEATLRALYEALDFLFAKPHNMP